MRCLSFNPHLLARLSMLTAAAFALLAAPLTPARAGTYSYTGGAATRTVNAGILLIDSTQYDNAGVAIKNSLNEAVGPDNPDPYIFYILNQRSDIKPFGWNLVNPQAPKTVTGDIQQRWDARTAADIAGQTDGQDLRTSLGGHAYQLGQKVSPNMGCYWEVGLSNTPLELLLQFDILMINLRFANAAFSAEDVEKLRRYVDAGGQLWIEDCGGGRIADVVTPNPSRSNKYGPLFFKMQFNNTGSNGFAVVPGVLHHPIISTPYLLSEDELNGLGDKNVANYFSSLATGNTANAPGPGLLTTVVGNSAHNNLPLIAAGQYGAGQIIVTSQDSGCAINDDIPGGLELIFGGNSGPYCPTDANALLSADTQDLKFLSNVIAWSEAHPNEHKNSHQTGSAENSFSSTVSPVWTYPEALSASTVPLPGAVVNGDLAYVTGADNKLHTFDITPSNDLDGNGNPDDGITDYNQGTAYDEVWNSTGTNLGDRPSAPMVASVTLPGSNVSVTLVFVEKTDGSIVYFNADTGLNPLTLPGTSGSFPGGVRAPAPTFYDGRIYAGSFDNNGKPALYVYDFTTGTAALVPIQSNTSASLAPTEYVTQPPTVGVVSGTAGANDIMAAVGTNYFVYSVFLGSRGERLSGNSTNFLTRLPQFPGVMFAGNANLRAYTSGNSDGFPEEQYPGNLTINGGNNGFTGTPAPNASDTVLADYDILFNPSPALNPNALNRNNVAAASLNFLNSNSGAVGGLFLGQPTTSAPALDRNGNVYYSVTYNGSSSLFAFRDSPNPNGGRILWRFRLPTASDGEVIDAGGADYLNNATIPDPSGTGNATLLRSLVGFRFVGAPAVDSQGNVYAAVAGNGQVGVLCFAGNTQPGVDVFPMGQETRITGVQVSQPINGGNDEFGDPPNPIAGGQLSQDQYGHITFNNFGRNVGKDLFPNLSEPQQVTISYALGDGSATAGSVLGKIKTNLQWYTLKDGVDSNTVTGLTQIGSALYLTADTPTGSTMFKVNASPLADGTTVYNKCIYSGSRNSSGKSMVTPNVIGNVGTVTGVLSGSNNVLIANGTAGVAALASRKTLVADNNRIVELDGDGDATWAVDSTTKTTYEGGSRPIYNDPNQTPQGRPTARRVTTNLELNRPSAVTQLSANDYLVVDTGNNRAVRFDRAGKVIWELTQFTDYVTAAPIYGGGIGKPSKLMTPGEPDTLNQPTGVAVRRTYFDDTFNGVTGRGTVVHYIVSDSGNYRILEIVDVYRADGSPVLPLHNLAWVSHTEDQENRKYRYQGANIFYNYQGVPYIVAVVTNTKVAFTNPNLTGGTPGVHLAANQDAPGASIVLLDYDPTGATAGRKNGYLYSVATQFQARLDANGRADNLNINGGTLTPLQMRNPRFLQVSSLNATGDKAYLYADDNGAFDLRATNTGLTAIWAFTQKDYQSLTTPLTQQQANSNPAVLFDRTQIPFVPSSLQRVGQDSVVVGGNAATIGRYMIATSFSQSEVNSATAAGNAGAGIQPRTGGEVLEIYYGADATAPANIIAKADTFASHTASRPNNTGPLIQPTFATRLK